MSEGPEMAEGANSASDAAEKMMGPADRPTNLMAIRGLRLTICFIYGAQVHPLSTDFPQD
jgi:hypothetical protein